jgi:ATP-dependent Lon protease
MRSEIEILEVEKRIRTRVKKQMEKAQKEYYLNEQMQAIQKELGGERDEFKNEIEELEERIRNKKMSKEATEKVKRELKKLKMMSPMSAEATVVRNYIDWVLSLPWYEYTQDKLDIKAAEEILEADHYGLKKPKERILEYLSVQKLVEVMKGPSCASWVPPASAKPRWRAALPVPPAANSCACRWVACATKPKFAAIAALTSARCRARSSNR